jgi:hypothetical protein
LSVITVINLSSHHPLLRTILYGLGSVLFICLFVTILAALLFIMIGIIESCKYLVKKVFRVDDCYGDLIETWVWSIFAIILLPVAAYELIISIPEILSGFKLDYNTYSNLGAYDIPSWAILLISIIGLITAAASRYSGGRVA